MCGAPHKFNLPSSDSEDDRCISKSVLKRGVAKTERRETERGGMWAWLAIVCSRTGRRGTHRPVRFTVRRPNAEGGIHIDGYPIVEKVVSGLCSKHKTRKLGRARHRIDRTTRQIKTRHTWTQALGLPGPAAPTATVFCSCHSGGFDDTRDEGELGASQPVSCQKQEEKKKVRSVGNW